MRIQNNIMAINAYRNYNNNTSALSKNLEKLSSGYRINRAGDDAAGLAISEKMRAQITGLDAAQKNVKDGISLVKTAEGAMQEIQDMLNRMKYLATQSSNGTYQDDVDREALQDEMTALTDEINRIADSANFNGQKLLNGDLESTASAATATATNIGNFTVTANMSSKDTLNGKAVAVSVGAASVSATTATVDNNGNITVTLAGDSAGLGKIDSLDKLTAEINKAIKSATKIASGTASDDIVNAWKNATVTAAENGTWGAPAASSTIFAAANMSNFDDKGLGLQIGDTGDNFNQITVDIQSMRANALAAKDGTLLNALSIATKDNAKAAVDNIVDIINSVSSTRGKLGAIQNRLEHTTNNLSVMKENIQDAESSIRDTDVAEEMMDYTKNNILIQSAQAMLAQANAVPQGVLQLLG